MIFRFLPILLFSFLVSPLYAGSYFVFYNYPGTVALSDFLDNSSGLATLTPTTAIAIRYEYDGPSPLKEALIKYFDGPTDVEKEFTGAKKAHSCEGPRQNRNVDCGASEIFKSVRIDNGIAYIELSGVPTSHSVLNHAEFFHPLWLTATQFPSVEKIQMVVLGYEVFDIDWSCPRDFRTAVCFQFIDNIDELKDLSEDWGWSNYGSYYD